MTFDNFASCCLMSFDNVVSAYGSSHFVDVVHIEIVDVFCFV